MDIIIHNKQNGRSTCYTQAELRKDALFAAKGKGKLVSYHVSFEDSGHVSLIAIVEGKDGWRSNHAIAI